MKRFQCTLERCPVIWVEQEDGSLRREEPGKGCWNGGAEVITAESRATLDELGYFKEVV